MSRHLHLNTDISLQGFQEQVNQQLGIFPNHIYDENYKQLYNIDKILKLSKLFVSETKLSSQQLKENYDNQQSKILCSSKNIKNKKRNKYTVLIMGGQLTGKTSLVNRYVNNSFSSNYEATTIQEKFTKNEIIDNDICRVEIIDTSGEEEVIKSNQAKWMLQKDAIIFVYSQDFPNSYKEIKNQLIILQKQQQSRNNIPIISIVGNKNDLMENKVVSPRKGSKAAKILCAEFYQTSAKNNYNVKELFLNTIQRVIKKREKQKGINNLKKQEINNSSFTYECNNCSKFLSFDFALSPKSLQRQNYFLDPNNIANSNSKNIKQKSQDTYKNSYDQYSNPDFYTEKLSSFNDISSMSSSKQNCKVHCQNCNKNFDKAIKYISQYTNDNLSQSEINTETTLGINEPQDREGECCTYCNLI